MSLQVDMQYVRLIRPYVRNFQQKNSNLWNFSCPLCGDSDKDQKKARGYVFRVSNSLLYKCHNCNESLPLGKLIKVVDQGLYDEYMMESFGQGRRKRKKKDVQRKKSIDKAGSAPKFKKKVDLLTGCPTIASLPSDHPARAYVESRKIPLHMFKHLYYTDSFGDLCRRVDKERFERVPNDARLIIPFFAKDGKVNVIQGRALDKDTHDKFKYITIKTFESALKVYGLDRLKPSERVYVLEGPIDSMFLPNALAVADGALTSAEDVLRGARDVIYIFDNQPRNKHVVKAMLKAARAGKKLAILPDSLTAKDINDMVLSGTSPKALKDLIDSNTYKGLELELKIADWRKC